MSNKTLIWFGDSYTVGNELGYHYGRFDTHEYDDKILAIEMLDRNRGRPDLAFPFLVTKQLGLNFLLFGAGGRAISGMVVDLIKFIKEKKVPGEECIAIFSFPAQYNRCFYIDFEGNNIRVPDNQILNHQAKYGIYETTLMLNSIYSMCLAYGIHPYFISTWSKIELIPELSLVPSSTWLVGPETTLVEQAWDFKDPPETWRTVLKSNNEIYEKYIQPCGNHPNVEGHKLLTKTLYEILSKRIG